MQLINMSLTFYGPHTEELASMAMDISEAGYQAVAIGKGDTKSEAAQRATALFRPVYGPIMDDIQAKAWKMLPLGAGMVEAPEAHLDVYAVIKIEVSHGEI